ncbi:MAG: hypothetical protein IT381_05840 [Deltaproteobacteria bacterium]|nr:hypothetical protein [Deltaproteobacteria bacterium]
MVRIAIAAASCLAFFACIAPSSDPAGEDPKPGPTSNPPHSGHEHTSGKADDLPCAIDALMKAKCQGCHGDPLLYGAPVPLFDVADFEHKDGKEALADVALRYLKGEGRVMPPAPNTRATDEEIAAFEEWVALGLPGRGDATCGEHPHPPDKMDPPEPPPPGTCSDSPKLAPASKYTLGTSVTDTYVCYGVDLPKSAKRRQVIAMTPTLDNTQVLHHMIVFTASKSRSGTPSPCAQMESDWKMLYGWAPGSTGSQMPKEAGFPIEANAVTHLVVQLHYSNPSHASGKQDGSGVELCLTETLRDEDADFMVFGGTSFTLQPGKKLRMVCDVKAPQQLAPYLPVNVFATFPHMHKLGTRSKLELIPKSGAPTTLVDVNPWDFNHQISYPTDVQMKAGDTVRITCEWHNTTPDPVYYGEETAEEMCFNFITYYPKITVAQWSYLAPLQLSTCTNTDLP